MQIVIDIPNNAFKNGICEGDTDRIVRAIVDYVGCCSAELLNILNTAIPLPKGHGRLIDADALDDNCDWCHTDDDGSWCYKCKDIDKAPTIIEADKEARE